MLRGPAGPFPVVELVLDEGGLSRPHRGGSTASSRRAPLDPAWTWHGSVWSTARRRQPLTTSSPAPRACLGSLRREFTTLPSPGGRLLCKFAAVSDVHIGEKHFGVLGRIHDPDEHARGRGALPGPVVAGRHGRGDGVGRRTAGGKR